MKMRYIQYWQTKQKLILKIQQLQLIQNLILQITCFHASQSSQWPWYILLVSSNNVCNGPIVGSHIDRISTTLSTNCKPKSDFCCRFPYHCCEMSHLLRRVVAFESVVVVVFVFFIPLLRCLAWNVSQAWRTPSPIQILSIFSSPGLWRMSHFVYGKLSFGIIQGCFVETIIQDQLRTTMQRSKIIVPLQLSLSPFVQLNILKLMIQLVDCRGME